VSAGHIEWRGRDLVGLSEGELRRIRGKEIGMIFQDPQASLNPVYTVGKQVEWVLKLHRGITGAEAKAEVLRLFESVKLRDLARCARSYPHELSGGMCQRVMIAMALAARPRLLIADEPTSALDVSVAAEIVSLLVNLQESLRLSILVITHDLNVAARLADRIAVLDHSRLVEEVAAHQFLSGAQHAASRKLINASRFMGATLEPTPSTADFSLVERT
jgi:ABC-type microcin C transport system duplicated ATPase subunit YejF